LPFALCPSRFALSAFELFCQVQTMTLMKKLSLLLVMAFAGALSVSGAPDKRIVLIAGKQSHGPGDHEFRAGCLLLQKCLKTVSGIQVEVYTNGWPSSDSVFEGASAVVIYSDGGGGHPAIQGDRMKVMDDLAASGYSIDSCDPNRWGLLRPEVLELHWAECSRLLHQAVEKFTS
jgi:hypothetical protein